MTDHLNAFLERDNLSIEQALTALTLLEGRNRKSETVELEVLKSEAEQKKKWFQRPFFQTAISSFAGAGAALIALATTYMTGYFDRENRISEQQHSIVQKEIDNQFNAFQGLIEIDEVGLLIDPNASLDFAAKQDTFITERKRRICLAVTFGLIDIPNYMLQLPVDYTDLDHSQKLNEFINTKFDCNDPDGTLPKTFVAPEAIYEQNNRCPANFTLETIQNRIDVPDNIKYSENPNDLALRTAIEELNFGVHEDCTFERILRYWRETGVGDSFEPIKPDLAWSGAFTSYLILAAGKSNEFSLSASNGSLFNTAKSAGLLISRDTKPEPGDFVFFSRGTNAPLSHSGIVLQVSDDSFSFISGNSRDSVRLERNSLFPDNSLALVIRGFARF